MPRLVTGTAIVYLALLAVKLLGLALWQAPSLGAVLDRRRKQSPPTRLGLAGCTTPGQKAATTWIEPGQAVLLAAAASRLGVTGVFSLTVRATGRTEKLHLNSEEDYRDRRNLSIAVTPAAAAELEASLGAPPEIALRGKRILVSGTARRTRIDFIVDDKPSGKFYYQTHVRVSRAAQIQVL